MEDSAEDIAVVGIGCNFPGGEGLENFWKVLLEGKNCTVQIPEERFDTRHWCDPDHSKAGKSITEKAALIERFNEFDHKFFGIPDAEADCMDPQQKLLLECTYRALENAGIPMEKASGISIGVFIGLMNRDYEQEFNRTADLINHYNSTGTATSIAANRISYTFNLTGPSFTIDSACSSSLVALHLACQAIKQGDCEMALCGGVSCIIEPRVFVALSKAKMISPEGTSKPFSSRADGYGRGEGCGIVLLKPLKKALKDVDHVWCIIGKTGVNQDGHTITPITKPSMVQQKHLLHQIYSTDTDKLHVQYIEAHGTGTPVGDPTEAESISKVIARARPPGSETLYIGSVKGNIGHTESAAGMAGLIKVILMMHHETIVPSLFYSEDSANIDTKALNLKIPTKAEEWKSADPVGRVAGINSFGFGGTNAHAVVQQCKKSQSKRVKTKNCFQLFILSAASEKSLQMIMEDTAEKIRTDSKLNLQTLAYTSACRRSHARHKYRRVFMATSLSNLQNGLISSLNKKMIPLMPDPKVIFVFCGNGVTYRGMCKQLLKEEYLFLEKIKEVDILFKKYSSMSIVQTLRSDNANEDSFKPSVVQPLLFTIQVAISSLLKHWGIRPDAVLGHSVGEVAAAYCSGLLSLEDAVKVIYFRSTLQSQVTGGKMLVVSNIVVSETLKYLSAYSGKICLAAFNSPQSCTLSGDADAIESLHDELKTLFDSKNAFLHILDVPAAYHSHMMDPILSKLETNIGTLQGNEMETELFSTVTGKVCSQMDFLNGTYWARNIREPVAFEGAVKSAAKERKNIVFVEIGPRRALQRNIIETLGNDTTVLTSVQPERDLETLLTLVSKLFELGVQVNWDQFYTGYETVPAPFPRYQFDCVKKEVYSAAIPRHNKSLSSFQHPCLAKTINDKEFSCNLNSEEMSFISGHKNKGIVIIPGSLYVELGLASFMANLKQRMPLTSVQLEIKFHSPFLVEKNSPEMRVLLEPKEMGISFKIQSPLAVYATGYVAQNGEAGVSYISLDCIFERCKSIVQSEEVYNKLSQVGFEYSSVFKQLGNVHYGDEYMEAVSLVKVPDELCSQLYDYHIHPVVLDYLLQMTVMFPTSGFKSRPGFPSAIGSLTILGPLEKEMALYLRKTSTGADYLEVCGCFATKTGDVLIEAKHVRVKYLGKHSNIAQELFFHNQLTFVSEDVIVSGKPKALVFADTLGISETLHQYLHQGSFYIPYQTQNFSLDHFFSEQKTPLVIRECNEVLFMWGIQNLSDETAENILMCLVNCCEILQQIILKLREEKFSGSFRALTFRLAGNALDVITTSFTLPGMIRSCAAEISGMSFQLIDINSVSVEDIRALGQIIQSYPCRKYPELVISKGQIYAGHVTRTPIGSAIACERQALSVDLQFFTLQIADAYKTMCVSAIPSPENNPLEMKNVEVQLDKVCVHSSDYFPVSVTDLKFGQTMYWNRHTSQNHKLLALDFSGTVTAVGKGVNKLKVGDHVASCYPIATSSKVVLPEDVCYSTKRFPFLKEVPCISYFVLSWEIFHNMLPKGTQLRRIGILSSNPDSSLVHILVQTANKSGRIATAGIEINGQQNDMKKCDAFVLLPPFDAALLNNACNIASVKHIVVVHGNQQSALQKKFCKWDNENSYIQTLHVSKIFQKANLKEKKVKIYNWLKSMHLDKRSLDLQNITFQKTNTGSFDCLVDTEFKSYFSSKPMPVIVLSGGGKNQISTIPVNESQKQLFKKNSVYIVTGGLSGLGFETVKFIAQKGGGNIVILSRRPPSSEMQQNIRNIQSQHGVSVISLQCDVSVSKQVDKAVNDIEQHFPSCPIGGVFHSAVVLHDGFMETLNRSHFEKVLRPKVNGALNLHSATRKCKLDYFVCYSSVSSFLGSSAQCNYAAANSFLDVFCHYRRNLGLAGQSVNWGALNLGLLLNKDHLKKFLEEKGTVTMEIPEIHECLENCLLLNNPQQVVCKFNFRTMYTHVLSQNIYQRMRFFKLVTEEIKSHRITENTDEQERSSFSLDEYVKDVLLKTCNIDANELNDDTLLSAMGVDSMLALTLQNVIYKERGANIPLVKLLDPNTTVSNLVVLLKEAQQEDFTKEGQQSYEEERHVENEYTQL